MTRIFNGARSDCMSAIYGGTGAKQANARSPRFDAPQAKREIIVLRLDRRLQIRQKWILVGKIDKRPAVLIAFRVGVRLRDDYLVLPRKSAVVGTFGGQTKTAILRDVADGALAEFLRSEGY